MHCFLSIKNLLLGLFFVLQTIVLAQSVDLPVVRQKGASLDVSTANEADHAMRQARRWLEMNPPANTETQTCALVQLALAKEAAETNLLVWATTAGLAAKMEQGDAALAAALASYPTNTCDPEALWLVSRTINQRRNGLLLRDTEALDWRNAFAKLLICNQRSFPSGGGYWDPPRLDGPAAAGCALPSVTITPETQMLARIRATAYGILALKEIHE
jgi:hypothetical protein